MKLKKKCEVAKIIQHSLDLFSDKLCSFISPQTSLNSVPANMLDRIAPLRVKKCSGIRRCWS